MKIVHKNYVDTSNELFFAEFDSLSQSFSCRFVRSYENKSCEIAYGAVGPTDQTCPLDIKETFVWHMNSSDNLMLDTVIVFIPSLAQTTSFCFTAIGKTRMFAVAVEGTFTIGNIIKNLIKSLKAYPIHQKLGTSLNLNILILLAAVISSIIIIIIFLALIAALSIIILKKKAKALRQSGHPDQAE